MATFLGKEGVVKVGNNAIAEVKSFSITQTAATVEDTVMGDDWATHKPTIKSWSGSLTCHWDDTDTKGQEALSVGTEVSLTLYPEGNDSGDYQLSGSIIITSVETQAAHDGLVERTLNFQGSGALIIGTVSSSSSSSSGGKTHE